jgi:drug/metabolite transporter (DMT)-like permease
VLRPEQREDGELEVVRLPLEQLLDAVELPVGEAECSVERLLGDTRQTPRITTRPDRVVFVRVGEKGARGYLVLLVPLAALWGASFLFIKVAVRHLEPSVVMEGRLTVAGLTLLPVLLLQRRRLAWPDIRAVAFPGAILGVVNSAVPFTLIAWGETHIDSGVAAIANASTPIWVAVFAIPFLPSERAAGLKLVGILLGLVGVGILTGGEPSAGAWAIVGTLAVVLASACYAGSNVWLQPRFPTDRALALVAVSMVFGALALLPLALLQLPSSAPGWKPIGSVLALGMAGTSVGLLVYYRMIERYGSARASLVTYLAPVAALGYGIGLLGEPLTAAEVVGLLLILGGIGLGSGLVRPLRRAAAPAA